MFDLELEVSEALTVRSVKDAEKQVAFALSGTLNDLAFGVRKHVFRPAVQREFQLSNRFLTKGLRPGARGPGGIGVDKATKRDLEASIFFGQGAEFLSLHEDGGLKLPPRGERRFFVPDASQKRKRLRKGDLVRQARAGSRPGGLLGRARRGTTQRTFIVGEGTPRERIVRRVAGTEPGKRLTKRGTIRKRKKRTTEVLGWMEPRGRIRRVLRVEAASATYIQRNYLPTFQKRFDRAMRTAR